MKTCNKCLVSKPESDFHRNARSKDGLSNTCKPCKNEYALSRYHAMTPEWHKRDTDMHRERYHGVKHERTKQQRDRYNLFKYTIHKTKSERGCIRCSESDPYALDFHHVAEKLHNIGNGSKLPKSITRAEIKKCIVLCANCHRKLHAGSWQLSDLYAKMESEYPEAYELLNQPWGY